MNININIDPKGKVCVEKSDASGLKTEINASIRNNKLDKISIVRPAVAVLVLTMAFAYITLMFKPHPWLAFFIGLIGVSSFIEMFKPRKLGGLDYLAVALVVLTYIYGVGIRF